MSDDFDDGWCPRSWPPDLGSWFAEALAPALADLSNRLGARPSWFAVDYQEATPEPAAASELPPTKLVPVLPKDERAIIAALAGDLFVWLHERSGHDGAAAIFEAMAKIAGTSRRRGRPRGTRHDPQLLVEYDARPESESLYAFALRQAKGDLTEADKIRQRINTLIKEREQREQVPDY